MSNGLTILSAVYGVGTLSVDVLSAVLSQTRDGKVNFAVSPTALNVNDPAPGQIKTLTVEYSINGGSSNTSTVKDGDYFKIDAPPERIASGLQIVKAEYGYEGNYTDVTDAVQNHLSNGSINITVSPSTVGIPDPNPSKPKFLKLDVTINGVPSGYKVPDGQKFDLSAPSADNRTVSPPAQTIWSIVYSVWKGAIYAVCVLFWFSATFLAMQFGQEKFGTAGKYLLGGISFITGGFFPVFVMPIIIFWWRLFSSGNVYTPKDLPVYIFQPIPVTQIVSKTL